MKFNWVGNDLHFIADFLDRNLWIKQARASFVECLTFLKAIKVVENVLKAFLKAMTQSRDIQRRN